MEAETRTPPAASRPVSDERPLRFGPAAAVLLAVGVGTFVLGLLTTLSEASTGIADGLQWSDRVGPLSGKTIIAAGVFFGAWGILALVFRRSDPPWRPVVYVTAALVGLGLVLTFPTFFQIFAAD